LEAESLWSGALERYFERPRAIAWSRTL